MAIFSIDDIRASAPKSFQGASDEELIKAYSNSVGMDPLQVANTLGYDAGKGSISGERWSSATDNYQAGLYETLGLGARALGAKGVSDWATRNAADNRFQGNVASQRAQQYGGIQSWDQVQGLGDMPSYVAGLGIQAAPYLAEAAVGGLAARGISGAAGLVRGAEAGLQTAARGGNAAEIARATEALKAARTSASRASSAGVVAGSYPSSVGDILGNMREQNGQTDDGYAALGGLAYAGLNALPGLEGAVGGGRTNMLSRGTMDAAEGFRGGLKRAGMAGLTTGASESLNETGQEFINQGGRVTVDPRAEMFSDEALSRYKESAIAGGLLGGIFGGAGNRGQRSQQFYEDGRTQDLIASGTTEREVGLRNMVGPSPQLVGPENGLYLSQYGQDEGPMYGQEQLEPQQPTSLDPNQYDMFNPDGSPTYGAASSTPMLDVDATRNQLNAPGAPAQDVINQTLGIGQRRYAGSGYPKQFEAAASAPTGQNLARVNNDQLESPVTALEEIQRQAGVLHPAVQAAAQQQMAVKRTAEEQKQTADWARSTFGIAKEDGAPAGELFGQPVFGASRLRDVALALGEAASGLTETQVALTNAIVRGGKLAAQPVKFAFKPDMVPQSVNKALDAVNKVAQTLQIDHVQTPAEAAAILNELSKTAKGRQLELIDAVHSALTGKSTEGFEASQQPEQATETKPAAQATQPAPATPAPVAEKPKFQRAPKPTAVATIDPAKTVTVGKSGRKKEVTAVELRQKMASASDDVKLRLQLAMGYTPTKNPDTGANMMVPGDSPRTFEEVGQMLGVSKQAVAQSLAGIGVDEQVINRAVSNNAPTVPEAELGLVAEDGVSAEAAAGMRVSDTAAQATGMGLVEGGTMTPEQKQAEVEANRILKTAPPPVEVLNAGQETAREVEARMEREAQERIDIATQNAMASPEYDNAVKDWNASVVFAALPARLQADFILEYEALVEKHGMDFPQEAWDYLAEIETDIVRMYHAAQQQGSTNGNAQQRANTPSLTGPGSGATDNAGAGQTDNRRLEGVGGDAAKPQGQVQTRQTPAAQKPDAPGRQAAEVKQDPGKALWKYLRTQIEGLTPYGALTENEQGALSDWAAKHPGEPPMRTVVQSTISQIVEDRSPGGILHEEGAQFSKSKTTQGSTVADVLAEVKKMLRMDALSHKITVVQSAADLPAGVQKSVNVDAATQGFVHNGKAYLIAGNIAPGKARSVFLHEVGAHLGLENLLGSARYKALVSQIQKWAAKNDGSQESQLAKAAQARVESAETTEADKDSELLAYFIEEAVDAGVDPSAARFNTEFGRWLRSLWAAFKSAVHKLGINPDKLTARDVVDMAYGAARLESKGQWHGTAAQFRKFDHKYMGSGAGAQAFGWGTYLAQKTGIAEGYWKTDVANKSRADSPLIRPKDMTAQETSYYDKITETYQQNTLIKWRDYFTYTAPNELTDEEMRVLFKLHKKVMAGNPEINGPEGALMRTDTTIADDEWLDLDKPMSEQSEKVRAAVRADGWGLAADEKNMTGREFYENVAQDRATEPGNASKDPQKLASEYLDSIGIKGNRFLDSTSRNQRTLYYYPKEPQLRLAAEKEDYLGYDSFGRMMDGISDGSIDDLTDRYDVGDELVKQLADYFSWRDAPDEKTSNFVVFNDKNIVRVASEIAANPERVKFSKAKPVTMQSVVRDVPTAATELMDYLKIGRDAVAIRGMFTEDLVNLAAKVIPAARGYLDAMKSIQAKRGAAERNVEAVLNQFRALSSVEQSTGPASVNAFIKESTFDNKWAFMPDWLPKGSVKVDADLAARFDSMLSDKAQEVVKAVFKHGYTSLQEMKKAALEVHKSEYDLLIAEAKKAGDAKEAASLERKKIKSMDEFKSLFAIHEFTPYAPLKRFGNYVVLAVSAQYKAAHAAGDTKKMQEMQSDGAHYHVEFAESVRAAKKLVALLAPKFPDGFVGKMEKADDSVMMGGRDTLAAFGRLRKAIKDNTDDELMGIDRKTAARMDDMMRQMYLTLLSESSARKSELHRKNVAGANGDMMRAFATQGRATAHFIAGLQTSGQVDDHLASMREQTRKLDNPELREQRQKYLNEILRRHSMGLEYHPSPVIDKLMSTSSVMMLLTNPAYHVMNALQPGLMTQPLLAARHGYYKSWVELKRAYTDLAPILKSAKFDETSYAKLPEDVREAINDLANRGVIDIMMDADLGRFESEPDSALRGIATVNEKLRHIAQNVEAMNRLSSAIAAYRLEKGKDRATHQSAVDYAAKVIYESHGDYSGFNAPRFMRNDIGRVLTQFRKFQLIQLNLVTREFHRAFFGKGTDTQTEQEVKTAGRYALAYTLAHLFATAGVMGLPGVAAIGWALGKMTPDDEPDDPEATLRRFIGNKFAADLLVKGAPKALGIDLSRTGAGNVLSLFPYADIDVSREGYPKLLMAATGPFFGGLLPRMTDGLTKLGRGEMIKGTEALLPNGVSNMVRAGRFMSEGITKANGDVTLSADEMGTLDVIAQAFGLPTNKVTDKNFLSNSQYNAEQFYKDKSSELKQRYSKAAKTNDSDMMRSLREEWTRVQATSKEVGIAPQPLQNLLKAPSEQRKREQGVQYGVAYTKKTAGYAPVLME